MTAHNGLVTYPVLLHVLDPFDSLTLRVHHQWPPSVATYSYGMP